MPQTQSKTPRQTAPGALRAVARLERRTAAAGDPEVDPRRFSFVLSTPAQDRNGRIVVQDWELDDFEKNPIVLWNHADGSGDWCADLEIDEYFPIGRGENVRVEGGQLVGDVVIASERANPLAERIFHALNEKILSACSVGWDPRERRFERHNDEEVLVLSGNRLIEISVVPFPANPDAVRASFCERARAFGTNTEKPNMALLATMAALFAMTASATEEQVSGRAKELIELERATFAATGATTPDAARAGVTGPFGFGDDISPGLANYDHTARYRNSAVGPFRGYPEAVTNYPANAFGIAQSVNAPGLVG